MNTFEAKWKEQSHMNTTEQFIFSFRQLAMMFLYPTRVSGVRNLLQRINTQPVFCKDILQSSYFLVLEDNYLSTLYYDICNNRRETWCNKIKHSIIILRCWSTLRWIFWYWVFYSYLNIHCYTYAILQILSKYLPRF